MKRPVLVLGAAGGLGTALVDALLDAGRAVVAVSGDDEALRTLAARFDGERRLSVVSGWVDDEPAAAALAHRLRRLPAPPIEAVVNLLAGCERGRLLDAPADFLERKIEAELLPHLRAARHVLPVLGESGRCARYLIVGVPYAGTPWLGYGHHSITAAAIRMLVQVLREESADSPVRVQQLVLGTPITTDENRCCARPGWPEASDVGRRVVEVLDAPDTGAPFIGLELTEETA